MDYQPPELEVERFSYAYIDETSQTKHRFLVIGGLVLPFTAADQFEREIIAARESTVIPTGAADGTPRVMKWQKVYPYNLHVYQNIVGLAFEFWKALPITFEMGIHCVVVDTSKKPLLRSGDGDIEVGFDKEFHFLCTSILPKWYRDDCFALYPDRRNSRRPLEDARDIMNRAAYKYGDRRRGLLRVLEYRDPEFCQALQITDILIGALAYKLNRHYEKDGANKAKIALCDYIWKEWKLGDPFNTTPFRPRKFMTWLHRPMPPNPPSSGPRNWR